MAIQNPGEVFKAGSHLQFSVRTHTGVPHLLVRMPSGNFLCYSQPRYSEKDDVMTYMGQDNTASGGMFAQWTRIYTYGGKIVENACQSLAMDVMARNMLLIEQAGFDIVLTVHDETVAEADTDRSAKELSAILAKPAPWAPGLPLAASGFECTRYRKD